MLNDYHIAKKYVNKCSNANKRKIKFSLTFSDFKKMFRSKYCKYTGIALTEGYKTAAHLPTDRTIERIDNKKGYEKGNVIAVCKAINDMKGQWENPTNPINLHHIIKTITVISKHEETKIYLGATKNTLETCPGTRLSISKHSWDCDWYWSFGYIGNVNLHTHFDSVFLNGIHDISNIFVEPLYTQNQWWLVRDLSIQAYALKKAAEVYRHGGGQSSKKGITDVIKAKGMADRINADLKTVLDKLWEVFSDTDELEREEHRKNIKEIAKLETGLNDTYAQAEVKEKLLASLVERNKQIEDTEITGLQPTKGSSDE